MEIKICRVIIIENVWKKVCGGWRVVCLKLILWRVKILLMIREFDYWFKLFGWESKM